MADSEEFRLKRLKHEQHLSRVFDEVMGLGEFADSSIGSATSSKSGGQDETKAEEKTSEQEEHQPVEEEDGDEEEEEDSNSSEREEKMDETGGETSFPRIASTSSEQHSSFSLKSTEGGSGGEGRTGRTGGAAFDDAMDGLDDDEDWHFALPLGSLEDVQLTKAKNKRKQSGPDDAATQEDPFAPHPTEEDGEEEEDQEGEESTGSTNTSHSSQDPTPDNSRDGGAMSQTEETEDSQQGEKSESAPVEDSNPQSSPPINIKEEPIDEGYDAALLPQSSIRQIKEELEHQEEELRISSVYSVGGGNAFASPMIPAAVPAPPPATIFIPSRNVLQAVAPLPVRPQMALSNPLSTLTPVVPPRPPLPPVPGSVRCSGCAKVLLKGQTAFQRKGSTQLFCSTVCLTGHLPAVAKNRTCSQCNREIVQPRDMVTIPMDNTFLHFCGQFCLSVFRHKRKQVDKLPDKWTEKRVERVPEKQPEKPAERVPDKPVCSVCKVTNRMIEHEVTHQGRLHRLCSNACFVTWRKMRQLAMNCCEGCGLYCNSNSGSCQTLTIERTQLNFCSPTCISTFKQTCRKVIECGYCRKIAIVSSTIMERDQKGKVQLYCSANCVGRSRPSQHILSGTAFPCSQCKISAVPQYHLAMVDGTIRNFCSYDCVTTYRKLEHPSQPELINGTSTLKDLSSKDPKTGPSLGASSVPPIPQDYPSSVPYQGHHPSHTSVPPLVPPYPAISSPSVPGQAQAKAPVGQSVKPAEGGLSDPSKLTCHQCSKQFSIKPLLLSHQGRISMFCSKPCCEQYKTQKNILAMCECCKQEKVLYDTISYNQQDLSFCSENCKLVYNQDQASGDKGHPSRPCSYCSSFSQKMLHSHYSGRMEEFCRPYCMSQYTVLYYGMGRCDSCRKQCYMKEKLQCLGSVRNFCNLSCLTQYCSLHFETSQHATSNGTGTDPQTPYAPAQPNHSSKNPVIADVVSLANGSATQPSVSAATALTGALPTSNVDGKNHDHASTQTDAMRVPVSRRRQMKNKSVLCRPFTMDQEISCQLPESSGSAAVSVSEPAPLDSASKPGRTTADASTSPAPSLKPLGETPLFEGVPARLTGRHFLARRDQDADCKVCSQHKRKREEEEKEKEEEEEKRQKMEMEEEPARQNEEEEKETNSPEKNDENESEVEHCDAKNCEKMSIMVKRMTPYYCKTCAGEPSLCPVPCFELYHTRLIYKTSPELEAQAQPPPSAGSSEREEKVKTVVVPVPVPVPVFIPVPMSIYSQPAPVPLTMTLPIPVPVLVPPPQRKDMKDASVQSEPLTSVPAADQSTSHSGEVKADVVQSVVFEEEDTPKPTQAESSDPKPYPHPEETTLTSDPAATSADQQPPSSPVMDLEADFPSEVLNEKPPAPRRGVKRPREGSSVRKRGRRRKAPPPSSTLVPPVVNKVNHLYGVKAWRSWVQQRIPHLDQLDFKEDVLQCDSAELSFALCHFIREVRRPNGEAYSPDSLFYLCLGIQQYLFMKGRIENIFTDELYSQFAAEITGMLQLWKPKQPPSGGAVSSRVMESHLWECKQLGAYSPIVLLNTLLFFCTKNFSFTTLAQHQSLSFRNFTRCSKPSNRPSKVHYLRHQRSSTARAHRQETERLRKRQQEEERDLEMHENVTDPLHCPVRLYEFYLSRCPESMKRRTDIFYLQPEKNVHTHSSHWYTCQPLESTTLQNMLTRILAVREVRQNKQAARPQSSASTAHSLP